MNKFDFKVQIHTLELITDHILFPMDEIQSLSYVKKCSINSDNMVVIAINPNKYSGTLHSLNEFNQALESILYELCIEDYTIRRLDVAFDSKKPYEIMYKQCAYFKELYALYLNTNNSYYSNGNDFTKRSLKVSHRDYELAIYNKKLESCGLDPANTRIEFRYKRLRKKKHNTVLNVLRAVHGVLLILPDYIDELSEIQSNRLINQYELESSPHFEGRSITLITFVSKYADFIYNHSIINALHNSVLRGQSKAWLWRYRKYDRNLTLLTKGSMKNFSKELIDALNYYIKSSS